MSGTVLRITCADVAATELFGARIGFALEPGQLLSLQGPLGAGKTSLVRGIASGAGADPLEVRSPTFVLHHVYPTGRLRLHHIDLYRLGPDAAVELLDLETMLEDGAVVAEWGDLAALDRWEPIRIGARIDDGRGRTFTLLSASAPAGIRAAWRDQ